MPIKISVAGDFHRLLKTLADELVDAIVFWRLHSDVQIAAATFGREVSQATTFWSLTQQATLDAAVFRLCKIYDQHPDSLNLKTFLETIQQNVGVFAEDKFRERLKDNAFVESLAAESRMPDLTQLESDLQFVSAKGNELVKILVQLRNNLYAHRGSSDVLQATDLAMKYPLEKSHVHHLLHCGMEIVNRYSQLFAAVSYSTHIIGHDDYKTVLESLRWDLARRDDNIHRESIRLSLYEAWNEVEKRKKDDEASSH